MVGIRTASEPGLTRHLATETEIFRDAPLVIVDIGSRGGFNAEWRAFGDRVKIYGFEPDEAECARLNAEAAPGVTYLPWAIGGCSGPATLFETKLSASSGLYRTNMAYFGRLLNRDNGVVAADRRVSLRTLQGALTELGVETIDFLKLDVEGAELDILRGSAGYLESAAPLGLLSEIRFQAEINGSPTFAELDAFLAPFGLRLYGLEFSQQSRIALPYPGLQEYQLPSGERFFAYTTHGQVQDGNALYFRDLLIPANRDQLARISTPRLLKLAALYELYSLNDCAAELILACRERIDTLANSDRLLNLLATGIAGHSISYKDYVESYFRPAAKPPGAVAGDPRPMVSVESLQRELAKVYASTSWRITKPLRRLKRSLAKSSREDS